MKNRQDNIRKIKFSIRKLQEDFFNKNEEEAVLLEKEKTCFSLLHDIGQPLNEAASIENVKLAGKALAAIQNTVIDYNLSLSDGAQDLFDLRLIEVEKRSSDIFMTQGAEDFVKALSPLARSSKYAESQTFELAEKLLEVVLKDDEIYKNTLDSYSLFHTTVKLYDKSPDPIKGPNLFKTSSEKAFNSIKEGRDSKKVFHALVAKMYDITRGGKAEAFVINSLIQVGKDFVSGADDKDKAIKDVSENYVILSRMPFKNGAQILDSMASLAMLEEANSKNEDTLIGGLLASAEAYYIASPDKLPRVERILEKVVHSSTVSDQNKKKVDATKECLSKYQAFITYKDDYLSLPSDSSERDVFSKNLESITAQVVDASKNIGTSAYFVMNTRIFLDRLVDKSEDGQHVKTLKKAIEIVDKSGIGTTFPKI